MLPTSRLIEWRAGEGGPRGDRAEPGSPGRAGPDVIAAASMKRFQFGRDEKRRCDHSDIMSAMLSD
jgi:hypothetical protein